MPVQVSDLKSVLPSQIKVVVAFIPPRDGCEFRTREASKGMQKQAIEHHGSVIRDKCSNYIPPC